MLDRFWEVRITLFDSHVDDVHEGFYRTPEGRDAAMKELESSSDGSPYAIEHTFEEAE